MITHFSHLSKPLGIWWSVADLPIIWWKPFSLEFRRKLANISYRKKSYSSRACLVTWGIPQARDSMGFFSPHSRRNLDFSLPIDRPENPWRCVSFEGFPVPREVLEPYINLRVPLFLLSSNVDGREILLFLLTRENPRCHEMCPKGLDNLVKRWEPWMVNFLGEWFSILRFH